ncbi:MAG TPA: twin-arginine translocase TatA/TatE family subunit [Candidatus Polarisedimenticolaceae bacterium]|nr:twin-arginine translocase TatA/TatE family subunit [Candidatus Polarisedimenticolaceae bacterium]
MAPLALFGTFGFQELIAILAIVVFLFGARKIPEIARGLGEGIRGFRSSLKGEDEQGDGRDGKVQKHSEP